MLRPMRKLLALSVLSVAAMLVGVFVTCAGAGEADVTDSARNTALPCEAVSTEGGASRAAKDIVHLANACGFVGTDVELQSRKDARGNVQEVDPFETALVDPLTGAIPT
jgi:hypothetical protein